MWPFSQWAAAGRAAVVYITVGAFTVIWSGVWYVYLFNNPPAETAYYWCTGFLVTGLIMVLIGSALAMISHSARHVELPLAGVPLAVANVQPEFSTLPAPQPVALAAAPILASHAQVVLAPAEAVSADVRRMP